MENSFLSRWQAPGEDPSADGRRVIHFFVSASFWDHGTEGKIFDSRLSNGPFIIADLQLA